MLDELAPGIWTVSAPFKLVGAEFGTRMTVIRVRDGGLMLIAPVAIAHVDSFLPQCRQSPQHGVDEPGGLGALRLARFDGGVDRGVVRHSVEQEELGRADEQRGAHDRLEFVPWLSRELLEDGTQREPARRDGMVDGGGERGVSRAEVAGVERCEIDRGKAADLTGESANHELANVGQHSGGGFLSPLAGSSTINRSSSSSSPPTRTATCC